MCPLCRGVRAVGLRLCTARACVPGRPRCRASSLRGSGWHRRTPCAGLLGFVLARLGLAQREKGSGTESTSRFPRQRAESLRGEYGDARTSGGVARTFSFSPLDNFPAMDYNTICVSAVEKYSRGRRGAPAKGVGWETAARVQIPPSPPKEIARSPWDFGLFPFRGKSRSLRSLTNLPRSRRTALRAADGKRFATRLDGFAVFDARSAQYNVGTSARSAEV